MGTLNLSNAPFTSVMGEGVGELKKSRTGRHALRTVGLLLLISSFGVFPTGAPLAVLPQRREEETVFEEFREETEDAEQVPQMGAPHGEIGGAAAGYSNDGGPGPPSGPGPPPAASRESGASPGSVAAASLGAPAPAPRGSRRRKRRTFPAVAVALGARSDLSGSEPRPVAWNWTEDGRTEGRGRARSVRHDLYSGNPLEVLRVSGHDARLAVGQGRRGDKKIPVPYRLADTPQLRLEPPVLVGSGQVDLLDYDPVGEPLDLCDLPCSMGVGPGAPNKLAYGNDRRCVGHSSAIQLVQFLPGLFTPPEEVCEKGGVQAGHAAPSPDFLETEAPPRLLHDSVRISANSGSGPTSSSHSRSRAGSPRRRSFSISRRFRSQPI